ncbi:hypothetical protein [Steroidobacter gossypii]|nr:hypothetical protein [Steroidobacter gossypii]
MTGAVLLLSMIRRHARPHGDDALQYQGDEQHPMEDVPAHKATAV